MKTYDDIKDLIKRLRDGEPCIECCNDRCKSMDARSACTCAEAADELEHMHNMLCKQQVIIRRVYAELLPDTWFVSGESGQKDQNGLPDRIEVCPAYGVGWSQVYEKTERTISTEGS
jgi:hypothetical protein